jgi:hypothetical protein
MAVYTEPVFLFAVPHPGPFPMESHFPITKHRPVALGTKIIRLLEAHHFAVCEPQGVPVVRVVAVKAPSARHMLQHDLLVHLFKFPLFPVHRHPLMALGAGEYAGSEWRGRHGKLLRHFRLGKLGEIDGFREACAQEKARTYYKREQARSL